MHTYQVDFTPALLPPLRILDAIQVKPLPRPHVVVGTPTSPGKGARIPLASRLTASIGDGSSQIDHAQAYRDPKAGGIVLGAEQADAAPDTRALVLLTAVSNFPEGVTVRPRKGITTLVQGEVHNGRQLLLIWPEGGAVAVEDPGREARYELRRTGDQFERTVLSAAE